MIRILLISIALLLPVASFAQWQPTTFHGSAFTLAHNSTVIVTSDTNGSFFHEQIGQEWSSDLGQTWHHSTNGPPAMMHIDARDEAFYGLSYSVRIGSPNNWKFVSSLWQSTDNAQTWDSIALIPANGSYHMDDQGFHYYGDDTMRYLSLDGKTWVHDPTYPKSLRIPDTLNFIALYNSDSIVAIGNSGVIMNSQDAGQTWRAVFDAGRKYPYWFRERDELLGSDVYDPFLLSTDRGLHWKWIDTSGILRPFGSFPFVTATTITNGYLFIALYGQTIMRLPLPSNSNVLQREANAVHLYPNPAQDVLHLEGLPERASVQIVDALGRTVLAEQASSDAIDVHALAAGTYTLLVNGVRVRFVK